MALMPSALKDLLSKYLVGNPKTLLQPVPVFPLKQGNTTITVAGVPHHSSLATCSYFTTTDHTYTGFLDSVLDSNTYGYAYGHENDVSFEEHLTTEEKMRIIPLLSESPVCVASVFREEDFRFMVRNAFRNERFNLAVWQFEGSALMMAGPSAIPGQWHKLYRSSMYQVRDTEMMPYNYEHMKQLLDMQIIIRCIGENRIGILDLNNSILKSCMNDEHIKDNLNDLFSNLFIYRVVLVDNTTKVYALSTKFDRVDNDKEAIPTYAMAITHTHKKYTAQFVKMFAMPKMDK